MTRDTPLTRTSLTNEMGQTVPSVAGNLVLANSGSPNSLEGLVMQREGKGVGTNVEKHHLRLGNRGHFSLLFLGVGSV